MTHCTLETICCTHSRFASAPLAIRRPVTFANTGCVGSWNVKSATTSANRSRADSISGEWNGPDTFSGTNRRAPAAVHAPSAAANPSAVPASTTCAGLEKLAAQAPSTSASATVTRSGARPITAAMPAAPAAVSAPRLAASIASPRACTIRNRSASSITPAAARAAYSPTEKPA